MVAGHCADAGDAGGSFTYFTNIYKLKLLKLNQQNWGLATVTLGSHTKMLIMAMSSLYITSVEGGAKGGGAYEWCCFPEGNLNVLKTVGLCCLLFII